MVTPTDLFKPPAPKKKSQGLFGSSKKVSIFGPGLTEVSNQVTNVSRRLRILEERYLSLRKKAQLTEQNMISSNKKVGSDVKNAFGEITELRAQVKKLQDQLNIMNSELNDCANKNDLEVIGKYIEFWEPMNFITEQEAMKIINEKFK